MQFEQAMSLVETQKLSIKLLQDELGEEAEFDAEETAQMRSVRRECETRVNNYEDRMIQLQSDMQKDIDKQVYLLRKVTNERDDARNEVKESQQSAMNMFDEQKLHEFQIDRMKDEVSRSNKAVDKMRDEVVRLRTRVNELCDEKSDLKKQHESHIADEESAARERDTVIAYLRSVLDLRNQQLNVMEQSVGTITEDRTRIQLHSTEATVTIVSLRQELKEARVGALTTRASEEAARLQISRMMDEQLAQNQTIDNLRRQVESSNTALQQAQALLRANQEQQSRMPPPNNHPSGAGGVIGNTPSRSPLSTPSTGFRTRELHGPDHYHVGSPADQGYAEHMRAMFGRDDMDPPRQEPPRQEQPGVQ